MLHVVVNICRSSIYHLNREKSNDSGAGIRPRLIYSTAMTSRTGSRGAATRQRLAAILSGLERAFPEARCELEHRSPFELLVATILSAQCTDKRVNEVTPGLFRKYPTVREFAAARQEELANDIRSTGFFNNKAKALIGAAKKILADFGGEVPK